MYSEGLFWRVKLKLRGETQNHRYTYEMVQWRNGVDTCFYTFLEKNDAIQMSCKKQYCKLYVTVANKKAPHHLRCRALLL
jgi:hypothetical protein